MGHAVRIIHSLECTPYKTTAQIPCSKTRLVTIVQGPPPQAKLVEPPPRPHKRAAVTKEGEYSSLWKGRSGGISSLNEKNVCKKTKTYFGQCDL